jgi:BirA family biotin operon repressor/biotin-[acetyl-CoA-carboxylase] ligase
VDEPEIREALGSMPLGGFRYFRSIGSTNNEAIAWARDGSPDQSLVFANEQTAGRGRSGRVWFTPAGTALAFSLILHPTPAERAHPSRVTGLGALALVDVCKDFGGDPRIKWPNDVLLNGRKVAGILVEASWTGSDLDALILGVGVNVLAASVPPVDRVMFPATCIEAEIGTTPPRTVLLAQLVSAILRWRTLIGSDEFIKAWESHLAYRGQKVQVNKDIGVPLIGSLSGLESDGSLRLIIDSKPVTVPFGEMHLRQMP